MLYAFSRDHGVLGSRWWKQVCVCVCVCVFYRDWAH